MLGTSRREVRTDDATSRLFEARMRGTSSGVPVTDASALRHSAVWSCLATISEAVMQLPLDEVVRSAGGSVRRDPPALFFQPAASWSWEMWIWAQVWTLAARGKCYAMVTGRNADGPTGMVPVDPSCVEWKFDKTLNDYRIFVDRKEEYLWPLGDLWHCPLLPLPGRPEGLSPIAHHAETIGVGLAAQDFGARFFGDGAHPTAVVTSDRDPGKTGAEAIKAKLLAITRGNREPLVLPQGVKLERWQIAPNESQFLETMRYSGEDVARIFGVPGGKIGLATSGQNVTYSNVASANADWRVSGLARYVVALESALSRLVPAGRRRTLRFDFSGFLRSDEAARAAFYQAAVQIGDVSGTPLMLTNEMRAAEGLPPLEGGDKFTRKSPAPTVQHNGTER